MAIGHAVAARGEVYLIRLDPTQGGDIRKTKPCLIVSPNELNEHLRTVIVAPMTTGGKRIHGESSVAFTVGMDLWLRINFVLSMLSDWRGDSAAWLLTQ